MGNWSSLQLLYLPENLEARGLIGHALRGGAGTHCPEQKKAQPWPAPAQAQQGNATTLTERVRDRQGGYKVTQPCWFPVLLRGLRPFISADPTLTVASKEITSCQSSRHRGHGAGSR